MQSFVPNLIYCLLAPLPFFYYETLMIINVLHPRMKMIICRHPHLLRDDAVEVKPYLCTELNEHEKNFAVQLLSYINVNCPLK